MKMLVILFLTMISTWAQAQNAVCRFDSKDYDSPGFSIPQRSGFSIKGRFGCVYRCACPNGSQWKVNHVLEESHFDAAVFSQNTGGPSRAKWFICPQSVKPQTWQPYRDELGRIIAYNVEPNYEDFPVEKMSSSPQIQDWLQNSCQNP